jgi:hypothetical protein
VADDLPWQQEFVFDLFFGDDGYACGDPPDQWHLDRVIEVSDSQDALGLNGRFCGFRLAYVLVLHLYGLAWLAEVPVQIAHLL